MTAPVSAYNVRVSRLSSSHATPPGSKSITNRALLLAALAQGETTLTGALDAEDTRIMFDALRTLGLEARFDVDSRVIRVVGQGGFFPNKEAELYVGNSGTTARFLTAALAFAEEGGYRLDGKQRMRERPIGDLLAALKSLDRDVVSLLGNDCPPLGIRGKRNDDASSRTIRIAADVSSQFLSGLLMAAPLARRELTIEIDGPLASRPYVAMTLDVMRSFGVQVEADSEFRKFYNFHVGRYEAREYAIEPDASAASYFFALPAILGGRITIENLSRNALQGDVGFVDYLEKMGCDVEWGANSITVAREGNAPLHGVDVDLNETPDVAQTLGVVALFADSPTSIRNVANMRVKETDRLAALTTELRKLGAEVDEWADGLTVDPTNRTLRGASIATYDDHRMAMSFALAGLRIPDVVIENPFCVAKTYPNYFEDLERVTEPV